MRRAHFTWKQAHDYALDLRIMGYQVPICACRMGGHKRLHPYVLVWTGDKWQRLMDAAACLEAINAPRPSPYVKSRAVPV